MQLNNTTEYKMINFLLFPLGTYPDNARLYPMWWAWTIVTTKAGAPYVPNIPKRNNVDMLPKSCIDFLDNSNIPYMYYVYYQVVESQKEPEIFHDRHGSGRNKFQKDRISREQPIKHTALQSTTERVAVSCFISIWLLLALIRNQWIILITIELPRITTITYHNLFIKINSSWNFYECYRASEAPCNQRQRYEWWLVPPRTLNIQVKRQIMIKNFFSEDACEY